MDQNHFNSILNFDSVRETAATFCMSEIGAHTFTQTVTPVFSFDTVKRELALTQEAYLMLYEHVANPISGFDDVAVYVEKAAKGGVLELSQLLKIRLLLNVARKLKRSLESVNDGRIVLLKNLASGIETAEELENLLDKSILSDTELSDGASERLQKARINIRLQKNKIKEKLNSYLKGGEYAQALQDKLFTVRNERYVLPVKSEYRNTVQGLLHDSSDSGATLYIEPIAVVEYNNKLKEAVIAEQEEIIRILSELSKAVADHAQTLENNQYYSIMCDIIFAKARYAESMRAVCPSLTEEKTVRLEGGRHPLIDKRQVVPLSLEFGGEKRLLLISGPNTGGKTVVLKTLGLFCCMAYSGMFLPCHEAELCVFSDIFCDVGDNQSIENNLSTFSSHIKSIVEITDGAGSDSLVLLDELGAGTDPQEGAALSVAIVGSLLRLGCLFVVTTHFSELKEFGLQEKNVQNACMEFDVKTYLPTYKLKMGLPGVSNALNVAQYLGLRDDILDHARAYIGEGKRTFEEVLGIADAARVEAECEREALALVKKQQQTELDALSAERKKVEEQQAKLNERAKQEVEKIVESSRVQAEGVLKTMENLLKDVNASTLLQAKQLRSSLSNIEHARGGVLAQEYLPLEPTDIVVGKTVIVKNIGTNGKIKTLPDQRGKLDILVGNVVVSVKTSDLGKLNFVKEEAERKAKYSATHSTVSTRGNAVTEINLLGQTVDEAIQNVEAFIDNALMHGISQVKIIHGMGTGALRSGLHRHFKRHTNVSDFRLGDYYEGGSGVTFLTLK